MTTVETGRRNLRDLLWEIGAPAPDWVAACEAVPRELLLPETIWPGDGGTAVSRSGAPEEWLRWAYTNAPLATQWDDGHHTGTAPGELATSSSSAPSLVFRMLAHLSVADGMKVLEIGTGTGWCAALLSARLGERNVVSVEIDAAVADRARKALHAAGWRPEVVTGDGLLGRPEGAPYDRVLVTAGVRQVPRAWIEQTRPGGLIVLPWGTHYTGQNAVARLTVAGDGSASGRFTGAARFMHLRSQRLDRPRHRDYLPGGGRPPGTRESVTALTEHDVLTDDSYAAREFALGLLVPDCAYTHGRSPRGTQTMWLYGLADRSWAAAFFNEDAPSRSRVYQGGPRDLWDEIEAAHRWWTGQGRPEHGEFGLTVTPDGRQEVWLREPSALLPRTAPTP